MRGAVSTRSYVLGCLGDLGFLDVLIDDFTTGPLREIDGFGLAAGFAIAVSTAEIVRSCRASRSKSSGGNSTEEKEAGELDANVPTIEEVRTKACNLVLKCLRGGPIKKNLLDLVAESGGRAAFNVLLFFFSGAQHQSYVS